MTTESESTPEMNSWKAAQAETKTSEKQLKRRKYIEIFVCIVLVLFSLAPPVCYHGDIFDFYSLLQVKSNTVAAWTTATYVSFLLLAKLLKDELDNEFQRRVDVNTDNTRNLSFSTDPEYGEKREECVRDAHRNKEFKSQIRILRYVVIFVSYLFISFSYSYIPKIV